MPRVGLFIPCYMDTFEPEVGIATLELLERLGCSVDYPFNQTCCGQPMGNTGCHKEAAATERLFVETSRPMNILFVPPEVAHIKCVLISRRLSRQAKCSAFELRASRNVFAQSRRDGRVCLYRIA